MYTTYNRHESQTSSIQLDSEAMGWLRIVCDDENVFETFRWNLVLVPTKPTKKYIEACSISIPFFHTLDELLHNHAPYA